MCGIIGFTGGRDAAPILIAGLKALEYRGYDSAGIAVAGKKITSVKSVGRISALEKKLDETTLVGDCGIGHTRWATHGCPTEENCHPHMSADGKFAVVHNGIIENDKELRALVRAAGIEPISDTDSEIVAHLLSLYYDGDPVVALGRTVSRLKGSFALGVLCADHPDEIYAAKMRSPLLIGYGDGTCLSSDGTAMPQSINEITVLADGQTARLTKNGATVYFRGRQVQCERTKLKSSRRAAGLSGYPHYMIKEMYEQPEAIARTISSECRGKRAGLRGTGVSLIGCGSSYNAALSCRPMLERVTGRSVDVALAGEFLYSERVPAYGRQCILLSQSGETADTISAAEEAKRRGYGTLAITNVHASTLTRTCDDYLCTRAGPEISVATTKGFTTQVAALGLLAGNEFAAAVKELPGLAEKALRASEGLKDSAVKFDNAGCVFFMGRGADYGAALEGALKLKEISYIPAIGIAAGELKHGSISLIEKGTPVIAVCTDDRLIGKSLLSIATVKTRGGFVIGVTSSPEVAAACDEAVMLPPVHPMLSAAVSVIPLQRLAYEVALRLGRDIDKPRNLAKSVTVE